MDQPKNNNQGIMCHHYSYMKEAYCMHSFIDI